MKAPEKLDHTQYDHELGNQERYTLVICIRTTIKNSKDREKRFYNDQS